MFSKEGCRVIESSPTDCASVAAEAPKEPRKSIRSRTPKAVGCMPSCWVAFSNCDRATMPQTRTRYAPTFVLPTLPRPPRGGPTAITLVRCARGRIFCFARWLPGPGRLTKLAYDPRSPNRALDQHATREKRKRPVSTVLPGNFLS